MFNNEKLYRLKITASGLSYDNYFLDLNSLADFEINNVSVAVHLRGEMEMIELSNGNYRLAFPAQNSNLSTGTPYNSVFVIDVDGNGNYIGNSLKQAQYDVTGLSGDFVINGIEFSPNGEKLYVTHSKIGQYQNSFQYYDLTQLTLTPQTVTKNGVNMDDFQRSQIESLPDGSIIVPANNRLIKISNANNPTFSTDFNNSYLTLTNYATVSPYTISSPSSSEHIRLLQDNIDGDDYSMFRMEEYTENVYTATTNATWEPGVGNNPFLSDGTNEVFIKEKLVIPAGKNITIKNMIFKFAPGAKVVIERSPSIYYGSGGKLTLDNTIFTVDDRCVDDMWMGVEVWGHPTVTQTLGATYQGTFIIKNSSLIEHAYVGALASKRADINPIPVYDFTYDGGIIIANNSTFYNNMTGVDIPTYYTSQNNLSKFEKNTFNWSGPLKKAGILYNAQVQLSSNHGIKFLGNLFKNSTLNVAGNSNFFNNGYGIKATNAMFYAEATNCVQVNCSDAVRNTFLNFTYGIHVNNTNGAQFVVDKSTFTNCLVGLYVIQSRYERITRNIFDVRESIVDNCIGLRLDYSSKYIVEENIFRNSDNPSVPLASALNYGIIVHNSGTEENWIYRNSFYRLKFGGQSQRNNGITITNFNDNTGDDPLLAGTQYTMRGLQWKCNNFNAIRDHDLTVYNGLVDYNQGALNEVLPIKYAANNIFSLSAESASLQHDFRLNFAQKVHYVHLANANQIPDSRTTNTTQSNGTGIVFKSQQLNNQSQIVYTNTTACPSNFPSTIIDVVDKQASLGSQIQVLNEKLEGGRSLEILNLIHGTNNLGSIMPLLVERSPFLSDDVLEAIIDKNPNSGQLKQILILNSALSKRIKDRIVTVDMPTGSRNQINSKQGGISQRELAQEELNYLIKEKAYVDNNLISMDLLDSMNTSNTYALSAIENRNNLASKTELFEYYLTKKDVSKQTMYRNQILAIDESQDMSDLTSVEMQMAVHNSTKEALTLEPNIKNQLINLKLNATNEDVKHKVLNYLLEENDLVLMDTIYYYPIEENKSLIDESEIQETISNTEIPVYVSIYPNPASGKVNLDFQNIPDGKMEVLFVDLSGKIVYQNSFENTNGELIDISEIEKGLYLVKILIDKQIVEVQKLEVK